MLYLAATIGFLVFVLSLVGIAYYSSPSSKSFVAFLFPDSISIFTCLLFFATVVLSISSLVQFGFLERSERISAETSNAAKLSAEVAKSTLIASQRAWIRPDEIGLGGGGLAFDQNGASVSVSFKITNVGNSPAINVTHHAGLIVMKNGGPFAIQEQKRMSEEIRNQPFGTGFTLFPGETFPNNIGAAKWSIGTNVSKEEIEKGRAISADGKHVLLYVYGCIDYSFPTDPTTHHQTGFLFELQRKDHNPISPDNGIIPIDQLVLMDTGIGLGRYAD